MKTLIYAMILACSGSFAFGSGHTLKITVVDDEGRPVPDVEVDVGFKNYDPDTNVSRMEKTDKQGKLTVSGSASAYIRIDLEKDGWYPIREEVDPTARNVHELKMNLRKIGNPIPLLAREVETTVPVLDTPCGFDLKESDWVGEHGEGKVVDVVFTATKHYEDGSNNGVRVKMTFPCEYSGAISQPERLPRHLGSKFKGFRFAPESGYGDEFEFASVKSSERGYAGTTKEQRLYIRSRVEVDESGKIVSANYAKLLKAVNVHRGSASKTSPVYLKFVCYFNPTVNDRNLEFDPKRNLVKGLGFVNALQQP